MGGHFDPLPSQEYGGARNAPPSPPKTEFLGQITNCPQRMIDMYTTKAVVVRAEQRYYTKKKKKCRVVSTRTSACVAL